MKIFQSLLLTLLIANCLSSEPNPPNWPDSVKVFEPGQSDAQQIIDQAYDTNGGHDPANHGQFSNSRFALLFKPGNHDVEVNVGFYTSVIGLGSSPANTILKELICEEGDYYFSGGALDTFWRSAENILTTPKKTWFGNVATLWAVSQAAPLRRVQINGDLLLFQYVPPYGAAGYASGGYMSNSLVTGKVTYGSQQQWMTRNANTGPAGEAVWNGVNVGCTGAPADSCTDKKVQTNVAKTPTISEKPFLIFESGKYWIIVPPHETYKVGHDSDWTAGARIDLSEVYVATDNDSAYTINAKLQQGLHLIFTPGVYNLEDTIIVNNANTVVLGMGYPTLIATNGKACIQINNVEGVRISGILYQAGPKATDTLLKVGISKWAGNPNNPVVVYDMFARVGGPTNSAADPVQVDHMVEINTGNTIIDNSWLWRADHDVNGLVKDGNNPCNSGIIVNGDDVTAYGLAAEHTLKDLVVWNGNGGRVYFYQSEFPYDVTPEYGTSGYTSFRVSDNVDTHNGYGIGAYTYFRDYHVTVNSGIVAPEKTGVHFHNSLTVFLNGFGQINHVLNNRGSTLSAAGQAFLCSNYMEEEEIEEMREFLEW